MAHSQPNMGQLTEHLFRETYQEVFSSLVVKYGTAHIDLIEDALQEAFYKALKSWKYDNYPENQKGWLFTVAKNHTINVLRREAKSTTFDAVNFIGEENSIAPEQNDQLRLLLACSKLNVGAQAKLIFTLKSICGFGVDEIANSLQISKENIYKQLQRSKRKLRELPKTYFTSEIALKFTSEELLYIELIIYFMFNEGYDSFSSTSKKAIHKDICLEAVRLGKSLLKFSDKETTKHLLSLFYFHMARFESRISTDGVFVSLREQDRKLWDGTLIKIGFDYLEKPQNLNRYYIEALIASIHVSAATFTQTPWEKILKLYDMLLSLNDSPIIRLNRAICLFELGKIAAGNQELEAVKEVLEDSYMYYSVSMAEYLEDKNPELSRFWYQKSLNNTKQDFRKNLIKNKMGKP